MENKTNEVSKKVWGIIGKILLSLLGLVIGTNLGIAFGMIISFSRAHLAFSFIAAIILPCFILGLIWFMKRKRFLIIWGIMVAIYFIALFINFGILEYRKSITIDTSPNINIHEYMPFEEESKIVKIDSQNLKIDKNCPVIDGAAALFPVYSAFVNAVYPENTSLYGGRFEYNNTPEGYRLLAEKQTDIFIGVYPSEEQIEYANECNTTLEFNVIGSEAFVFFVHKDNPIDNLTTEQIQDIYSGKITNWKEVGGDNEEIAAFQRNEGSGSQSMLKRFMGDKPIMDAPTDMVNSLMSGIIEEVSDYKSKSNSIGFSFRYYVEGIINNPDIKVLSVDGVAPTSENIKNGTYPIITPLYAVTYEENTNENVDKLVDWILSDEGQYIIEETGYVGVLK